MEVPGASGDEKNGKATAYPGRKWCGRISLAGVKNLANLSEVGI
jgi:hypothetical protein